MLTFQEVGGSPVEQYSYNGFTATRQFLIPWEQRIEFAAAVFGNALQPVTKQLLKYPGRTDVYACKLRFEPQEPESVNVREMSNLKTDFVNYNGSFAKAIIEYQTLETADRTDGPINEEGTSITYRMVIEPAEVQLTSAGWKWSDTNSPLPDETLLTKIVPVTTHFVTWNHVVDPPWNMISERQGTVNNASFLGCAAGTLLFMGAEVNKLYVPGSGLEDGPSSFVWSIKYAFREKAIKMYNNIYGWNHLYRESGGWFLVNNGSFNLYDGKDFNQLFQSVLPDDVP